MQTPSLMHSTIKVVKALPLVGANHGAHVARVSALSLALVIGSCSQTQSPETTDVQTKPTLGAWGVETQYLSSATKPGDDFYKYVNEGWLNTAEIPVGLSRYSVFNRLTLEAEDQIKEIVNELSAQNAATGTPAQQLSDLYAGYLDVPTRDVLGISMLQPELQAIRSAPDRNALAALMGRLGYDSPLGAGIGSDPTNPEHYMVQVSQSGLGLPGRDYYLKDEAPFDSHRQVYVEYLTYLLNLAGETNAAQSAQAILGFETKLAHEHWPPAEQRDILKMFHPMSFAELQEYAPGFNWQGFFAEGEVPTDGQFFVGTDTAVKAIAGIYAKTDLDLLKSYSIAHLLNNYASFLSEATEMAKFHLYQRTLSGVDEPRPIDTRGVQLLNAYLGEQLGKIYVDKYFPPANKVQMEQLVGYLRLAFRKRLAENTWMDDATRAEAYKKLEAFNTKIGYPDQWHDYSSVTIDKTQLVQSIRAIEQWLHEDALAKLREGRRDWEWFMPPQMVNAYYSPSRNEIVFPAAILQAPFFDHYADPAVNFGAIGMVIGHEMGHGFDDQGSRYDSTGTLRDWWTPTARENFEALTQQLVTQFNGYEPLPNLHVNGQLTLGENIGDLGGLTIAYTAWQMYQHDQYKGKAPKIKGVSGDQRFFMSYAQMWRSLYKTEALRMQVLNNPHSPGEYRVNGIVNNFTPWYDAFKVKDGSAMYLPVNERISIW